MPVPITVKHGVQQVNADRWDVNQKSKAINWRGRARTLSGRKRERRIFLPRERGGKEEGGGGATTPVFRAARTRRPRSPRVRLECAFVCFFFFFFFSRQGAAGSKAHTDLERGEMCVNNAMTRRKKNHTGYYA